jgi:putative spermidine/putrescine transport system substrate-binding protein
MSLTAGGTAEVASATNPANASWEEVERAARSSRVNFYMWGGSAVINDWIDTYVAGRLRELYDIELRRVPMDAAVFVNKLLTEKQAGRQSGVMDLLWINGENFKNAREAGLLFGPFSQRLPNFRDYVDSETVAFDFGFPVEGYESPYGRAQFVFEYDSAKIPSPPLSYRELESWIRRNPGRFTYPQPPDFTGSAFIRQVFYAVTGGHGQYMGGFDQELFARKSPELWRFLRELRPFLWQQGRTYPKDIAALDTLFERGEVDFNMSYHQTHAQNKILTGQYTPSVRTFVMTDGSLFNTHFTAIPFNAPNKPGALVAANFLLSPDAQYSKNDPANWGDFTVLDVSRLPAGERSRFAALDLGEATVSLEDLARHGVPEIPSGYLEQLERGWEENVLRAE